MPIVYCNTIDFTVYWYSSLVIQHIRNISIVNFMFIESKLYFSYNKEFMKVTKHEQLCKVSVLFSTKYFNSIKLGSNPR